MSQELNVPFLGNLPLDPLIARCCDKGLNPILEYPYSTVVENLNSIISSNFIITFIVVLLNVKCIHTA